MNLLIHGNHVEVTPALRDYVQVKLTRVERHFDQVIDANVQLTVEKLRQRAEITLRLRGNNIHVESVDNDMYAAIDMSGRQAGSPGAAPQGPPERPHCRCNQAAAVGAAVAVTRPHRRD